MVRWMRWHCSPDTGFEIQALAVWGRARYLSVTKVPHNTKFHTWMGKKHFRFFQTAESGSRTLNSSVKGSGANHYPRAPAPSLKWTTYCTDHPPRWIVFTTLSSNLDPTLVPRATLRGVAELHVASGMPQWRMFVTCCYFQMKRW